MEQGVERGKGRTVMAYGRECKGGYVRAGRMAIDARRLECRVSGEGRSRYDKSEVWQGGYQDSGVLEIRQGGGQASRGRH